MKKNTDLRSVDGQTVHLPQEVGGNVGAGNIALPNIYTEDSVQQYPIGTRLEMGERVFHYFKSGTVITNCNLGVVSYDCRTGSTVPSYDTAQAAGVGTAANPFKMNGSTAGDPALNYYAGHTIVMYPGHTTGIGNRQMQVLSSSASAADPLNGVQTVELVLDQPTPMAMAANTGSDLFPSKYADVRSCFASDSGYLAANMYPVVGVSMCQISTAGYWGWVQTYGPCFVTNTSTQIGDDSYSRTAMFNSDGSVEPLQETIGSVTGNQIAGWTLATGDGSGSEWIQLILDR